MASRPPRLAALSALLIIATACSTTLAEPNPPLPTALRQADLQPHEGDRAERARRPLNAILQRLPTPDYLPEPDDAAEPPPGPTDAADGDRADDAEAADNPGDQADADATSRHADRPDEPMREAVRLYTVARSAILQQNAEEALRTINRAINLDPDSPALHELHGRVLIALDRDEQAVQAFQRTLERDPRRPLPLFLLGRAAYQRNQYDHAAVLLGRVARMDATEVDPGLRYMTDYYLGQTLLRLGYESAAVDVLTRYLRRPERFDRSTTLLRQVIPVSRQRGSVAVRVGDAALRLGRLEKAADAYAIAATSDRAAEPGLLARRVYTLLRLDRDDEAEQVLTDALVDEADRNAALGLIDYLHEHTDAPQRFAKRIARTYREQADLQPLALALARVTDDPDHRRQLIAKHLRNHPGHDRMFAALLNTLPDAKLGQALNRTIELIDRAPDRSATFINELFEREPDVSVWREHLASLDDRHAGSAAGWYLRGTMQRRAHAFDEAEEAFNRALDQNPDFYPAQQALIEMLIDTDRAEQALRLAETIRAEVEPRILFLRARAHAAMDHPRRALRTLDDLLQKMPDVSEYRLWRGRLLIAAGRTEQGERALREIIADDPIYEPAYRVLFDRYSPFAGESADREKYLQLLQTIRTHLPASRTARLESAVFLDAFQGRTEHAEQILRTLQAEAPDAPRVTQALVRLLVRDDRPGEAIDLLTERLDRDPRDGQALNLLRQVAQRTNKMTSVFNPRAEAYLEAGPFEVQPIIALGQLYIRADKNKQAADLLQRALAAHAEAKLQLHTAFAAAHAQADHHDRALTLIEAVENDPDADSRLVMLKAEVQAESGETEMAVKTLRDAIDAAPAESTRRIFLRQRLASLYMQIDRVDRAIAVYDDLVADYPDFAAELRYEAGVLAGRAGREKVAERQLLKALDHDPDHPGANNNLGYTWVEAGKNLPRAEAMIRKAVAAEPKQSAYLDSLGWVLYKQGEFEQAVTWLQRAVDAPRGDDPVIQDHLGDALWRTGQREAAVEQWRRALTGIEAAGAEARDEWQAARPAIEAKLRAVENDADPDVAPVHHQDLATPDLPPVPVQ